MRWILVFILLYLIPLTVLFKNYKSFKRACIYGSIYVILSTTMVITNIYLSGLRVLEDTLDYENDLVLETYLDQYDIEPVANNQTMKKSDLQKIDEFRKKGANVDFGAFGENLVVQGIELHTLPIGQLIQIGDALLEVTQIGKKCHDKCQIYYQVGECIMPKNGIFTKVIKGGRVKVGDECNLI